MILSLSQLIERLEPTADRTDTLPSDALWIQLAPEPGRHAKSVAYRTPDTNSLVRHLSGLERRCRRDRNLSWKGGVRNNDGTPMKLRMLIPAVIFFGALVVLLGLPAPSLRASQAAPIKDDLASISERGRNLALYDAAIERAAQAMQKAALPPASATRSIARQTDTGWVVDFGQLNEATNAFLVSAEAKQIPVSGDFAATPVSPARMDTGFDLYAASAIETCLRDFGNAKIPYKAAVLPAEAGQLFVYFTPAQTKGGKYIYGADARYLVSADGTSIVAKRQMHKGLIETDMMAVKTVAGVHGHILSDVPEDSDVMLVLRRKPKIPEYVGTKNVSYRINTDGSIEVVK